jgi:3-deoxy-manno-octulosonate cytidylyltransferase (CMP-KDO synthetase)
MKILGVIPSRYDSSRLPGKPLKDICGKPMVWWVYQLAIKVPGLTDVIVATDDERIVSVCEGYNIRTIMTSKDCFTGTDRVAEVASKIEADVYVTIQGDEPLLEPMVVQHVIDIMFRNEDVGCATLKTAYKNPVDVVNGTTPKVVCDVNNDIMLFSRSPIPYPKASLDYKYYKPMGIYAFRPKILEFFANTKPSFLEKIEEIELLRLLENGVKIRIEEVESDTIAVDTEKDLNRVCNYLTNLNISI